MAGVAGPVRIPAVTRVARFAQSMYYGLSSPCFACIVGRVIPVLAPLSGALPRQRGHGRRLLAAGAAAFAVSLALYALYAAIHPVNWTLDPVDLRVYRDGGLIVRHVRPLYDPRLAAPLYQWGGSGLVELKFTYPPFAAAVFAALSLIPLPVLARISEGGDVIALVAAAWFTFGGLGYRRGRARLGAALLTSAAVLWTEPVLRTMYLGQVNLALMALILWDLCQPDTAASRWWKGAGTGIAAGIKLVPLIFVPYLLLTRRFRQALMACAGFAFTVLAGFAVQPRDSALWWFGGVFIQGRRTGFIGWVGNQSLRGLITRLTGSMAGAQASWIAAAVLVAACGLACAAMLGRAGSPAAGLLGCALTGLLVSPVSWDHHWVWIVPGTAVAGHYAARAWQGTRRRAWALWALAAGIPALYGAWPGSLWGQPHDQGAFSMGVIWAAPYTDPLTYAREGDQPWYPEYHWHGLQLITGNAFLLGGLAAGLVVAAAAIASARRHGPPRIRAVVLPAVPRAQSRRHHFGELFMALPRTVLVPLRHRARPGLCSRSWSESVNSP
jgi:alpha-1,2-mannosyltransferase